MLGLKECIQNFSIRNSIMKKIKNKFILAVISIIVLIVFSQVFMAYSNSNVDANSYLTLIQGNASINEIRIQKDTKNILNSWDKIHVIWDESLAVIEWWDGSLTRLWGNTKISIEQNQISRDYTNINISFELLAWKTWSNVVSFIWKDSSFTQNFSWIEAWVRGTIFNVDLDADYVNVTDHQITLQKQSGEVLILEEDNPLKISTFSLIDIWEFVNNFQDTTWRQINESYDSVYFDQLKKVLQDSIWNKSLYDKLRAWISPSYRLLYDLDTAESYEIVENTIADISENKREKVYKAVLSRYQDFNFVWAWDYEFYKRKIFYKKALIALWDNELEKEQLVRSSAFDIDTLIASWNEQAIQQSIDFLAENKTRLQNIDLNFFSATLNKIPTEKLTEYQDQFQQLESLLPASFQMPEIPSLDGIKNAAEGKVKDFLNDTQSLIDQIRR